MQKNKVISTKQAIYEKSKGKIIVTSHFSGEVSMSELIYGILTKNIESNAA